MTKKIFQDDGQRFELGSLGKSGQGLARQGLLGGMGWSSGLDKLICMRCDPRPTNGCLPGHRMMCVATVAQPRAYLHGSSGWDGSYHFQTRYLTNIICMVEVWVGLVISCPDMI